MVLYARECLPPLCPANLLAILGTQAALFWWQKKLPEGDTTKNKRANGLWQIPFLNCHISPNSFVFGECVSTCHSCILTLQTCHQLREICFGVLATVRASHKIEIRERLPSGSCHPHIRGSPGEHGFFPILNLQIKLHMWLHSRYYSALWSICIVTRQLLCLVCI
jgi:hypothetical protein